MYELQIGGKVVESPYLDAITTALLIDNFERYPELRDRPGLKDRLGPSPGEILHDGHPLMGCDVCHDLRQPFQPYGGTNDRLGYQGKVPDPRNPIHVAIS